jgi:hypothetical protein
LLEAARNYAAALASVAAAAAVEVPEPSLPRVLAALAELEAAAVHFASQPRAAVRWRR